ncbi:MAG: radical SAM protein [Clostridiales bacterium]|nr:radical SAM protein [Clostridiales bacterium]
MKSVIAPKYNRQAGETQIALKDMPDVVTLWATGRCNFKCRYCIQSADEKVKRLESFPIDQMMSWDTFLKCVGQIQEFGKKLTAIVFCGVGEPLLNPRLEEMISYIKQNHVAGYAEVVTNAALLTEERSLALIDAGLDFLSVSIQGVSTKSYFETCGVSLNIDTLVKRLTFFANHKTNCHLHVKTVDIALKNRQEYQQFADLFGDIADSIFVDHAIPLFKNIDYTKILVQERDQYTGELLKRQEKHPCALLFNAVYVQPDGRVVPCCTTPNPVIYGSIYEDSIKSIWEGNLRKRFMIQHLKGNRKTYSACRDCVQPEILSSPEGVANLCIENMIHELSKK